VLIGLSQVGLLPGFTVVQHVIDRSKTLLDTANS
jgi:hypothetical protein